MLKNDARLSLIRSWLARDLGWRIGRISVASADASFRRYFRVSRGDVDPAAWAPKANTLIVMDAPPGKEDVAPYLKVSSLLEQAGAHVPHVHASDGKRGFIVMEDLGDTQYLSLLKTGRGVDKLYGDALTTLANIQVRGLRAAAALPPYDRAPLERELNLMPEWFLRKHLGLELSPEERALLTVTNEILINEALLQPQVFVHRDFHSRNLMVLQPPSVGPGVIDFQDALRGPIGYDLVSLLKDCYISWSRERVERWVRGYRRVLGNLGANVGDSEYQFMRWFDLIGVQRHIKVLGIFARLWHRDGKIGYLADLPLTLEYVRDACRRYPELVEFERWLAWRVVPQLELANAREKEKSARVRTKPKTRKPKRKAAPREEEGRRKESREEKGGSRSTQGANGAKGAPDALGQEGARQAKDAREKTHHQAHGETRGQAANPARQTRRPETRPAPYTATWQVKVMVLAAGRGERMRPLTDAAPKPLLRVGGKRLIEYHLERLSTTGFREVVINTAWLGDMIEAEIGTGSQFGLAITYSHERPEALETGGGIFNALPLLGSAPFLLVNGDVWTDIDFGALRRDPPAGSLAHLVLVPNPPQHARGDFLLENGLVSEGEGLRHTYSGVGIFRSQFFAGCQPGKFPLLPLLLRAIAQRALSGELHRGRWYDIGTTERLAALDAQLTSANKDLGRAQ